MTEEITKKIKIDMDHEALRHAAAGCPFDSAFCALYNGRPLNSMEEFVWYNADELLKHEPYDRSANTVRCFGKIVEKGLFRTRTIFDCPVRRECRVHTEGIIVDKPKEQ